jgi:hypothetical protein
LDPNSFDPELDPVFLAEYRTNPDPDPIQIQALDDQKLKKFIAKTN